jgi:hypothetical protein
MTSDINEAQHRRQTSVSKSDSIANSKTNRNADGKHSKSTSKRNSKIHSKEKFEEQFKTSGRNSNRSSKSDFKRKFSDWSNARSRAEIADKVEGTTRVPLLAVVSLQSFKPAGLTSTSRAGNTGQSATPRQGGKQIERCLSRRSGLRRASGFTGEFRPMGGLAPGWRLVTANLPALAIQQVRQCLWTSTQDCFAATALAIEGQYAGTRTLRKRSRSDLAAKIAEKSPWSPARLHRLGFFARAREQHFRN